MIKVIHVITDTNIGGAGKCILNILELYDRKKLDIEILIPTNSLLKPEIEQRNGKLTEVCGLEDTSFKLSAISKLYKLFKQKRPDVIHTHAAMSARIAARLIKNSRIVFTRHSVFDQPKKYKAFPLKQIRGGINNIFSDKIIAVSPAAKDNLVETGTSHKKIEVVYNGVKKVDSLSEIERQAIRENYNISPYDFVVAIIARLEDVKGHSYVLDAAKILCDKNIKFIIAGTGSLEKALRQRAEDEKLNNVIFTGFIKDIYEIENIMDIQINASYGTEATSLSLLEGMCLGKPSVVTDFGGNPFIIKENINGIVIPRKNAIALAEAISTLQENNALYEKLSKGAYIEFEKNYTAEVMVYKTLKIYEDIILK